MKRTLPVFVLVLLTLLAGGASADAAKPFPKLLPAEYFRGYPVLARAYAIANEIPGVIAQQPCYCWCEANFRHKSLLDCYASEHGAG